MSDAIDRLNAALDGRYTLERELGEGGMATVYLARDLKHDRNVALKVLKPELAAVVGADRFLVEIKTTANLQHPNVLALYDSGEADGFLFYVMPYVRGESLRDRLGRETQLPVDEAVRIAAAVAQALDYAHREGVIHRDIKPGNILLQDGQPVVADFGIALAVGTAGSRLTETGLSVGTPWYMSPEQATGDQAIGSASDTYSLAAVLYEMLTGEPPYTGSTAQAVLARIIQGAAAPASELRSSVPANVDAALRKGLERLPADRFGSTRDFAAALSDTSFRYGAEPDATVGRSGLWNPLSVAATVAAVLLGTALIASSNGSDPATRVLRTHVPAVAAFFLPDASGLVLRDTARSGVFIRRWEGLEPQLIPGTDGVVFFNPSPDGERLAFVDGFPGPLTTVPIGGGAPQVIVPNAYAVQAWTERGIFFNTIPRGIQLVAPEPGAEPVRLTEMRPGETIHSGFRAIPGERFGVFQVWFAQNGEDAEIWALDQESGERHPLTSGATPRLTEDGRILFVREGRLFIAPFDGSTGTITGPEVPTGERIYLEVTFGGAIYDVSSAGDLFYFDANDALYSVGMARVSFDNDRTPIPGTGFTPRPQSHGWRLSPDGTRMAFTDLAGEEDLDIWVLNLETSERFQLTFDVRDERHPSWSADGASVIYARDRPGGSAVWRRDADGSGVPELLLESDLILSQPRLSPDGRWIVARSDAPARVVVFDLTAATSSEPIPLAGGDATWSAGAEFSPDGSWLAYSADRTGTRELYVEAFPPVADGPVHQVSEGGGWTPRWTHAGDALLYLTPARTLMRADVATAPTFAVLQNRLLFSSGVHFGDQATNDFYDLAPGDLDIVSGGSLGPAEQPPGILVTNWLQELDRRLSN